MDISVGNIQAKKISVGNLNIAKVSVGNTLVWPPVPTDVVYYGAVNMETFSDPLVYNITVPDGATRMGVCFVGSGGTGDTGGQGAGGAGGTLAWFNANVTPGQVIVVRRTTNQTEVEGYGYITDSQAGYNSTPGAPGAGVIYANAAITRAISSGGDGGDTNTTGRAGGGGGAGGYVNGTGGGIGGFGAISTPGAAGTNGGSGGGGGNSGGPAGGAGGSTHLYGQGSNGAAGSGASNGVSGGAGGKGSPIVAAFNTLIGGGGGGGRYYTSPNSAFAIRFFAVDYPTLVEPLVSPIIVSPS